MSIEKPKRETISGCCHFRVNVSRARSWPRQPTKPAAESLPTVSGSLTFRMNREKNEIYVTAFPEPLGSTRISTDGGVQPEWRRDGRELFYRTPDRKLMAVPVK